MWFFFFDDIDIDCANYADDRTPYAYNLELDKVIEPLENIDKPFHWFSDNFLKANPDKWHLLINADENVALKIKNEFITSSSNEKLLGILFNKKFDFEEHVTSLCRKASKKLNALARVVQYMDLAERRLIMNAFIFLQFGYCLLVWMFHTKNGLSPVIMKDVFNFKNLAYNFWNVETLNRC